MMETTPSGTPASASSSAMRKASSGVSGDGLSTIVQPASRAGASFDIVTNCGTFHGTMAPTTPTPSLRTLTSGASRPRRRRAPRYPAHQLLGVRQDDIDRLLARGVDPLTTDEQLLVLVHALASSPPNLTRR